MKTRLVLVTVTVLGCLSGCAKPDWIQQTLVTADVTGVWTGTTLAGMTTSMEVRLDLEQRGPKVVGDFRVIGGAGAGFLGLVGGTATAIDGTVAGDVFTFKQRSGALAGDFTVSGDEMVGSISSGTALRLSLRRVSATPRPASRR